MGRRGDFRGLLGRHSVPAERVASRTQEIHAAVLAESAHLDAGNFTAIHADDLARLFAHYDRLFFRGHCRRLAGDDGLTFRLSPRMTRTGGKTARITPRGGNGKPFYEIAVSTPLLFGTFRDEDEDRPIHVTGVRCRDRLQALQRVFEHELVHLAEMLVWEQSACTGKRFRSIAARFFGHSDHRHQLITPRERAFREHNIGVGDTVRFEFEGRRYRGMVNRITKRATVLVADPDGDRYSDGNRYQKFYIPLTMLERVEDHQAADR